MEIFIQKLLARMAVDEARRALIEHELRSDLSALADEGRRRGLTHAEAESEAIRHFAVRSRFARAFNLPDSLLWSCVGRSIPFAFVALLFLLSSKSPGVALTIWCTLTAIGAAPLLWRKAEVDSGLVLRPFLRRARRLEFSQLVRIAPQPRHLFGARRVVFEFDSGRVTLPETARGMRAVLIAIKALRPDVLDPQFLGEFLRLCSRLTGETRYWRPIAICCWLLVLGPFLIGLPLLWRGDGLPNTFIGLLPLFLWVPYHTSRLPSRPRAAVLNVSLLMLLFSVWAALAAAVIGNAFLIRQLSVIVILIMSIGLIVSSVNLRPRPLLVLLLAAAGAFGCLRGAIRPAYLETQNTLAQKSYINYTFTWIDGGQASAWVNEIMRPAPTGDNSLFDATLVIAKDGTQRSFPLERGIHLFIPPRPGTRLTLASIPTDKADQPTILRTLTGDRIESVTLPYAICLDYLGASPWSTDGRYLYVQPKRSRALNASCLIDMTTNKSIELKQELGNKIRWLDAKHFRTCAFTEATQTTRTGCVTVHETDIETLDSNKVHEFKPAGADKIIILAGMHYALVPALNFVTSYSSSTTCWNLLDLETGKTIEVPDAMAGDEEFEWDAANERLCYPSGYSGDDDQHNHLYTSLVLFHPAQGVLRRLDFDEPQSFHMIRLAPSGEHVLVNRSNHSPRLARRMSLMHTEIWDLGTKNCRRLYTHDMIAAIFLNGGFGPLKGTVSAPSWSPQATEVVYPIMKLRPWKKQFTADLITARP